MTSRPSHGMCDSKAPLLGPTTGRISSREAVLIVPNSSADDTVTKIRSYGQRNVDGK